MHHTITIRSILSFGLSLLLLSSTALQAADFEFCDNYARKSVQQQVANVAHECGNKGLRWSPLYQGQLEWCMSVRKGIAENENKEREAALARCGVTSEPIQWRGLKGVPSVWDRLFAEEMKAVLEDDPVSLEVMQRHGVNINHDEGFNNGTILYHAIKHQAERSVRYLVGQGANPNRTTNGGWNPLINLFTKFDEERQQYVDIKPKLSLLQFLLNNGADPNSFGESGAGGLPLDKAAAQNDIQAATILLSAGANPNQFDSQDGPLLMRMLDKGYKRMVTLLVNRGANVNRNAYTSCREPAENMQLPLDKALELGYDRIVRLLKNRGAKTMAECLAAR